MELKLLPAVSMLPEPVEKKALAEKKVPAEAMKQAMREAAMQRPRIIRTVSPCSEHIFAHTELTSRLALHETTRAAAIRSNPMGIGILEWESRADRAAQAHQAESSGAGCRLE
jgi:hypothetical protein